MLIFCNYLEAHIMMCDIKLIRVFLSCYKRILLSHQIIPFSSTLFIHTSLPLSLSYSTPSIYFSKKAEKAARKTFSAGKGKKKTATEEQKNRRTTQSVKNKNRIKVVWKKTQGMRRDLGHKGCGRSHRKLGR